MPMTIANFTSDIALTAKIHHANPNLATELTNLATALGTDPTTYDVRLQTPPAGLVPGAAANTRFLNDCLLIVNEGKGSRLTPAAMGTAITSGLSQILTPVNTAAPVASGTGTVGQTLTTTNGTWNYAPTSYTYQWYRSGSPISGANASTYVLVAADSGKSVGCAVGAVNPAGPSATSILSNTISVA
jgi:hypothetical protein